MSDQQSQEQLLEQQKANCIFCRIVAGQMEAKKVYEDDEFLAILDIKPAAKGHVLLLPKEHVPILQLLPYQKVQGTFTIATKLSIAIREALAAERVTILIASGAAAGQQAPHLLVHLIPREPGDRLDTFDLSQRTIPQTDALRLAPIFTQATEQVLTQLGIKAGEPAPQAAAKHHISAVPARVDAIERVPHASEVIAPQHDVPAPEPAEARGGVEEFHTVTEALQTVLATNDDLRRLIIAEPNLVAEYISRSPKLQKLFEGVNIQALSLMLRRQEEAKTKQIPAREMSEEELFALIDGNEGLRSWLLDQPEELAANLNRNPRLAAFFAGVDILDLARRYRTYKGVDA